MSAAHGETPQGQTSSRDKQVGRGQQVAEYCVTVVLAAVCVVLTLGLVRRRGTEDVFTYAAWSGPTLWLVMLATSWVLRRGAILKGQPYLGRMGVVFVLCGLPVLVVVPLIGPWYHGPLLPLIGLLTFLCLAELLRRARIPERRWRLACRGFAAVLYAFTLFRGLQLLFRVSAASF